ncbi:hypothetical protein [uncultured Roseibium sp.]|uniref:hypothetical protein n=1 Tax=uncultured Roseibium sp. TaxID=1936171 RepID=UPI0026143400|nr:hypothetical protein [uncultured Roseibium sp.]
MEFILPAIFVVLFLLTVSGLTKLLRVGSLKSPMKELASFTAFVAAISVLAGCIFAVYWLFAI